MHFADTILVRATLNIIANSSGTAISWSSGSKLKKTCFDTLIIYLFIFKNKKEVPRVRPPVAAYVVSAKNSCKKICFKRTL